MPKLFDDRVVLITGAASGLGRASALAFAAEGAAVFAVDLDAKGLDETLRLSDTDGGRIVACNIDIATPENCRQAVATAVEAFGRLDVLCNIAGIIGFAHATAVTTAAWEKIIAVNLSAPFYLSQAALPHLLEAHGNIVNVASSAAFVGEAYLVPYATTKAGLVHMTRSMAMEYMKQPIRINAIAPGGMMTAMANQINLPEGIDFDLLQRFTGMRTPSQPEEVAELLLYLASDRAKSVHGACFSIDGGITAG